MGKAPALQCKLFIETPGLCQHAGERNQQRPRATKGRPEGQAMWECPGSEVMVTRGRDVGSDEGEVGRKQQASRRSEGADRRLSQQTRGLLLS